MKRTAGWWAEEVEYTAKPEHQTDRYTECVWTAVSLADEQAQCSTTVPMYKRTVLLHTKHKRKSEANGCAEPTLKSDSSKSDLYSK